MTLPRLVLHDDARARAWAPFSSTRPVGELLYGCMTLRERAQRAVGAPCVGHLSHPRLQGFDEHDAPPVLGPGSLEPTDAPTVVLSSRYAPPLAGLELHDAPARLTRAGATVGWVLPPHTPMSDQEGDDADVPPFDFAPDAPSVEVSGELLEHPWHLVQVNAERIRQDVAALWPGEGAAPTGTHRIGDGAVSLAGGAEIEPGVVLDVRDGPIRLAEGVRVEGPGRLVGPLYVGPGSLIFGGHVGTSSIGPICKIRGELADSVVLGYVNKAHDGYLGHALVGRWVNLGAMTTNSDLKNNYGSVSVWTPGGVADTGLMKVGCFLGDHVKTGIGTVLNTGTVIGAGSNVFGGAMPPTLVPPFSWGAGAELVEYRLDKFLENAERAMARRDVPLSPGLRRVLERAWHESEALRAGSGSGRR